MNRYQRSRGFTLVELLVVIGIIALLISILLPALNAARRQAAMTKCAAQMKQLHVACLLYAQDNNGYFPPTKMTIAAGTYNLYDATFPISGNNPFWFDFLSKYVTKKKIAVTSTTAAEAADARASVIWSCPSFEGYNSTAIGGINRGQTGVGMNCMPTFSATNPDPTLMTFGTYDEVANPTIFPKPKEWTLVTLTNGQTTAGSCARQTTWGRQSANRMLFSDSRFWLVESRPAPADGSFPEQSQINNFYTFTTDSTPQTLVDVYRHGKYPPVGTAGTATTITGATGTFARSGGKVAYNIVYADGHVQGCNDQRPAYESIRQRYPN